MKTFVCFCQERNENNSTDALSLISNFIDRNIRVIKYVSYGLAVTGLFVIGRSIHITKQFYTVKDIPADFITKGIQLNTLVETCSENGILRVSHTPILPLFKKKCKTSVLPVSTVGIEHTTESVFWMKENILGKPVWCDVLKVDDISGELNSVVYYKMSWLSRICINEYLVKQGLVKFDMNEELLNHNRYDKLLKKLTKAERYAEKKGKGLWKKPSYRERARQMPENIKDSLYNKSVSFFEKAKEWIKSVFYSKMK